MFTRYFACNVTLHNQSKNMIFFLRNYTNTYYKFNQEKQIQLHNFNILLKTPFAYTDN